MIKRIYDLAFDSPAGFFVTMSVGTWVFIVASSWLILRMALPGDLAKVESLRTDAALVDPRYSEDIAGLVAEENRRIAKAKRYNHVWWSALLIPNEWDSVERIEIGVGLPERERAD